MEKRLYELMNLCSWWLQMEEVATSEVKKQNARIQYEKEFAKYLKMKEKMAG